jgi:hypothetical protein
MQREEESPVIHYDKVTVFVELEDPFDGGRFDINEARRVFGIAPHIRRVKHLREFSEAARISVAIILAPDSSPYVEGLLGHGLVFPSFYVSPQPPPPGFDDEIGEVLSSHTSSAPPTAPPSDATVLQQVVHEINHAHGAGVFP